MYKLWYKNMGNKPSMNPWWKCTGIPKMAMEALVHNSSFCETEEIFNRWKSAEYRVAAAYNDDDDPVKFIHSATANDCYQITNKHAIAKQQWINMWQVVLVLHVCISLIGWPFIFLMLSDNFNSTSLIFYFTQYSDGLSTSLWQMYISNKAWTILNTAIPSYNFAPQGLFPLIIYCSTSACNSETHIYTCWHTIKFA